VDQDAAQAQRQRHAALRRAEFAGQPVGDQNPIAITMLTRAGVVKAAPSTLSLDGTGFQIAWQHS